MLKMNTRQIDGIAVIDCVGRIVFGEETSSLREEVKRNLDHDRNVVLNLAGVTYVDSGGLGTLISLHSTAKAAGSNLKLVNLSERVDELLQVTKLATVFDVCETESRAIEALRRRAAA